MSILIILMLLMTTPPAWARHVIEAAAPVMIAIDVDGAGTGAQGLGVNLTFQLP